MLPATVGGLGLGRAVTTLRIGVVGAGQISGAYLGTLRRLSNVAVVAVSDLDEARAGAAAAATPGARPLASALTTGTAHRANGEIA